MDHIHLIDPEKCLMSRYFKTKMGLELLVWTKKKIRFKVGIKIRTFVFLNSQANVTYMKSDKVFASTYKTNTYISVFAVQI